MVHDNVGVILLQLLLDEAQQMLGRHRRGVMNVSVDLSATTRINWRRGCATTHGATRPDAVENQIGGKYSETLATVVSSS